MAIKNSSQPQLDSSAQKNQGPALVPVQIDKENKAPQTHRQSPSKQEIVGTSAPRVGSALDMIKSASTCVPNSARPPLVKQPSSVDTSSSTKQRTVSSSPMLPNLLVGSLLHAGFVHQTSIYCGVDKAGEQAQSTPSSQRPQVHSQGSGINESQTNPNPFGDKCE